MSNNSFTDQVSPYDSQTVHKLACTTPGLLDPLQQSVFGQTPTVDDFFMRVHCCQAQ